VSLRPRLFCEFPAGLASVSLRLQGGAHCRPPISRLGNKAGYAKVILGTLGLHSGQGAGGYWWAEADRDVAALLRIYPDPEALLEVASIIRGWKDEEPRALWERLRAERKERIGAGSDGSDPQGEVAGWAVAGAMGYRCGEPDSGYAGDPGEDSRRFGDPRTRIASRAQRLAEYAMIAASNRLICVSGPDLMNTGDGGTRFGGEFATPPVKVAEGMEALRNVAEYAFLNQGSFSQKGPDAGIGRPEGNTENDVQGKHRPVIDVLSDSIPGVARKGWPTVRVSRSIPTAAEVSAAIGTPGDLEGCVVYMDGPYYGDGSRKITGYLHELTREEQLRIAADFDSAGATVAVSECVGLARELGKGWNEVDISSGRVGQKRSFSEQQTEFVTMNRTPGFKIAKQYSLFGVSQ